MSVRFGTDLGGVVITLPATRTADGRGFEGFLHAPAVRGALSSLKRIVHAPHVEAVFAICKCKDESEILDWLDINDFFGATGIPRNNLYFCRKVEEKAGIAEDLGLDYFVDDTPAVFTEHMRRVVRGCMLYGTTSVPDGYDGVVPMRDWDDVTGRIL